MFPSWDNCQKKKGSLLCFDFVVVPRPLFPGVPEPLHTSVDNAAGLVPAFTQLHLIKTPMIVCDYYFVQATVKLEPHQQTYQCAAFSHILQALQNFSQTRIIRVNKPYWGCWGIGFLQQREQQDMEMFAGHACVMKALLPADYILTLDREQHCF